MIHTLAEVPGARPLLARRTNGSAEAAAIAAATRGRSRGGAVRGRFAR